MKLTIIVDGKAKVQHERDLHSGYVEDRMLNLVNTEAAFWTQAVERGEAKEVVFVFGEIDWSRWNSLAREPSKRPISELVFGPELAERIDAMERTVDETAERVNAFMRLPVCNHVDVQDVNEQVKELNKRVTTLRSDHAEAIGKALDNASDAKECANKAISGLLGVENRFSLHLSYHDTLELSIVAIEKSIEELKRAVGAEQSHSDYIVDILKSAESRIQKHLEPIKKRLERLDRLHEKLP
jgi:hypothetical protein